MPPASRSSRIHGLDTLRALAIVLVFLYHYMVFVSHQPTFGMLGEVGWAGVDLFFALSGYLIGNQIFAAMRDERPFSLGRFYARRMLRTLPNFYVVLALFYLMPGIRGTSALLPVWKFLTFTQNYQLTPGTAFSHAWSLCIEEQFYVLLPLAALLIAGLRRSRLWAWVAVAASFAVGLWLRHDVWTTMVQHNEQGGLNFYRNIYYSSFCRFDELVAGVALALLKNFHAPLWTRLTARGNLALAAGLAIGMPTFYVLAQDQLSYVAAVLGFPLLALSFSLLIVAALGRGSLLHRTRVPGAASLALWSYAIYLIHKPVCVLASAPLQAVGLGPDGAPAVLILSALSVLAGWLLFALVETPFMALRDRLVPTNFRAPRAAAGASLTAAGR